MTGFEPATSWSQTRRSSQAEPHPVIHVITLFCLKIYIPSKLHTEFLLLLSFHPFLGINFLLPIHSITFWLSPRPISNSQLHVLPHFHLCPIYLVVFKGSYYLRMGYLILRGASRLDAFSVYPVPAWLLCHEPDGSTDTPVASPPRSSRTKGSSSQISYARAG